MTNRKQFRKILSFVVIFTMITGTIPSFAAGVARTIDPISEPNPETFKYMTKGFRSQE